MVNEKLYEEIIVFDEKRAATIIGNKGETKAKIEKITHTVIEINKGIAKISGKDILNIETAVNILSAISIGFTPNNAIKLKELDVFLTQISFKHKNKTVKKLLLAELLASKEKYEKKLRCCVMLLC